MLMFCGALRSNRGCAQRAQGAPVSEMPKEYQDGEARFPGESVQADWALQTAQHHRSHAARHQRLLIAVSLKADRRLRLLASHPHSFTDLQL